MSKIKKVWHIIYGIIISIVITCLLTRINQKYSINILSSSYSNEILKSTITFVSIITGFSGGLMGQVINAKNNKSDFYIWYFKTVDKTVFKLNILLGTLTAFLIVGISIILLANDIISSTIDSFLMIIWTGTLIAFLIYQLNNYYLFLKMLLTIPEDKIQLSSPRNINKEQEKNIYNKLLNNSNNQMK